MRLSVPEISSFKVRHNFLMFHYVFFSRAIGPLTRTRHWPTPRQSLVRVVSDNSWVSGCLLFTITTTWRVVYFRGKSRSRASRTFGHPIHPMLHFQASYLSNQLRYRLRTKSAINGMPSTTPQVLLRNKVRNPSVWFFHLNLTMHWYVFKRI